MSTQSPPRPPDELIDRVVSGFSNDEAEAHRRLFDETGQASLVDFERALAAVGSSIAEHKAVLEFGCGCGRIMRWMEGYAGGVELFGTDIDARAIEWAQENLSFARFDVNGAVPPTGYADGQFDLILNHSVFTHLDAHYQDLWLDELARIAAPDALLLLSVHGEHAYNEAERALEPGSPKRQEWRDTLERDGILFIADDNYVGSAFPDFYHTAFHAPWYLFEHWGRWFEIVAFLPRTSLSFQDQLILRPRSAADREGIVRARPQGAAAPAPTPAPGLGRGVPRLEPSTYPSRYGAAGELARRAVFRLARPVTSIQDDVNRSLAGAVSSLGEQREGERMPPLVGLALRQQSERIERLEKELDELRRSSR
jgi:hypothetical protein